VIRVLCEIPNPNNLAAQTMTTVVPTSDEDASLSVVRFASELAWADAGPECVVYSRN
ncbi:eukaryotic translation initiation factor 3 subunit M, partial [Trifolium medium]|nr:eukaryotic translation initiation factor 3 subunit M [Trifolium medium]